MLNQLEIRNLGVVEHTTAEFSSGFTVVTGETGAGKTMVVTGLRLLSGARADASRVRHGSDRAEIEGIFELDHTSSTLKDIIQDIGGQIDPDTPELIMSRTLSSAGRSRAHVAAKTVPAGILSQCSAELLRIHGQNDQLRLLDPIAQLHMLDRFAGLESQRQRYYQLRQDYLRKERDYHERLHHRRERALEAETLERAITHINSLDPQPGEDRELKSTIAQLQDADTLRRCALGSLQALDGDDDGSPSVQDLLGQVLSSLSAAAATPAAAASTPGWGEVSERVESALADITDISSDIAQLLHDIPDPDSLEDLLQRQAALKELRKYAADIDGVLLWRDEAVQRLQALDVSDEAVDALKKSMEEARDAMQLSAEELSRHRHKAATLFGEKISTEIRGLHMNARLEISLSTGDCAAEGMDSAEFMLIQGGQRNPLAGSASGGELSRVMLALEVVVSQQDYEQESSAASSTSQTRPTKTLVFDEIDAGVGGRAAVEIGFRLSQLATHNQVIVVTHLPQVAAFADAHLHVAKSATEDSVTSSVRLLGEQERIDELSRMLAGLDSDTGRAHAEELLAMARQRKA